MKSSIKSYLLITIGTVLIGIGLYFFEFPNKFSTGGIGGVSIVLGEVFGFLSQASWFFILNIFLTLVGLLVLGKGFAFKTIYSSVLLSTITWLFEWFFPMNKPLTDQKVLEMFFDVILISIGSALIFNEEGSSGGSDIIAMILKRYTTLKMGFALFIVDFFVISALVLVFGIETGIYSLFIVVLRTLVVDSAIENLTTSKYFVIITDRAEKILYFINDNLERGATIVSGTRGAFTGDEKVMIMTVVSRSEAVRLKHEIKKIDKKAFSVICNSSDIIGDGFRAAM